MKSSSEFVTLQINRSPFIKMAPVLLWVIAIFVPVLAGRNLYLDTFKQEEEQLVSIGRDQLMTRAHELEARLEPEQILKKLLNLDYYRAAYENIISSDNHEPLASLPLARALPDFDGDIMGQLASFSLFLSNHSGIRPAFVMGLHPDPQHCGLYLVDASHTDQDPVGPYRQEFSKICKFLNERSTYNEDEPRELRTFERFSFFSDYLGIFYHFNTHFWFLYNSFSGLYRERLYLVSMRPPFAKGQGNHILVGILGSMQSPEPILRKICSDFSDSEIRITTGRTNQRHLPCFFEETGQLSMLMELPELFRVGFKRPESPDQTGNLVIKLSISIDMSRKAFKAHVGRLNLAILVFLSCTFLLAAGTSLGRNNMRTSLSRLITAAFFVSMFLPLSGLAWLGAANSRTSREVESQHVIHLVKQKLRESEIAFRLQRYRQQLLMYHVSQVLAGMSPESWGNYVDRFFFKEGSSGFKKHFDNFYLYSAGLDREFYRGQRAEERFRKNELPNVLSGAFKQALLHLGAFSHLSEAGRQKIAQVADFASGIVEEIVSPEFFNNLFSNQANLTNATILTRRDLLTVFFLRTPQRLTGLLCLVSNSLLTTRIIDEINACGSFKNRFTMQNHRIEIDFFSISEFYERRLSDRYNPFAGQNPPLMPFAAADALYSNSDTSTVNNLHLNPPHLLVTDTILERTVFVIARITPPAGKISEVSGTLLFALIGIISCLALAAGISRIILMPVPPFLEALSNIENNRYDWHIDLRTGDEFDSLAASFNSMKIGLLERRKMLQLVSQTAAEAVKTGENIKNKPIRREATILLSDIRSFTSISETHSAEEVVEMLNSYFTLMCPAIEEQGGQVDKLIGDAIQAVFFADNSQERVLAAARAALEMRRRLTAFNADRAARGLFTINNGVGIASGTVTTGLTGSATGKLEAAVLGEPLQKAAWLESCSKFARHTCIIIDEDSYNHIRNKASVVSFAIELPDSQEAITLNELQDL
ncbi:MAG TPA: adenylate/guanylate cyclase domain-containing protein [Candidatus Rifleibacterium sp.]|nr:adenylate/guanylate cyclase domain-containing protein [Candidatus Rifleibacterium sp.]HPT44951.1 adenylate/guanylate cyclase domain-containing protein [Candidatus Rifleibacterium sp.]